MVVIEHNIGFLVSLCQRVSVMSEGQILAEGDAAAMVSDPRVRTPISASRRPRRNAGGIRASRRERGDDRVEGLDLSLAERGRLALLGPNGAGKTASVEAIAGLIPKAAGQVIFDGSDITNLDLSRVVRRGLALVPQLRELFPIFG
jgi:ABC-type branched-subunit amino acid transport system ATPase component